MDLRITQLQNHLKPKTNTSWHIETYIWHPILFLKAFKKNWFGIFFPTQPHPTIPGPLNHHAVPSHGTTPTTRCSGFQWSLPCWDVWNWPPRRATWEFLHPHPPRFGYVNCKWLVVWELVTLGGIFGFLPEICVFFVICFFLGFWIFFVKFAQIGGPQYSYVVLIFEFGKRNTHTHIWFKCDMLILWNMLY